MASIDIKETIIKSAIMATVSFFVQKVLVKVVDKIKKNEDKSK